MKRSSLILAVCLFFSCICGIGSVFADDTADIRVIDASETIKNAMFVSDLNPYISADNYSVLNNNQANDARTMYAQPAFFKFDLSDYADGYDIIEAQLVWLVATNKKYDVYGVPSNDLTLTYSDGKTPDRLEVTNIIASTRYNGESPLTGYEGIPSKWNIKFDITQYVKDNMNSGAVTVMVYTPWGGSGVFCSNPAKLWVKASKKPVVNITAVNSDSEINTRVYENVPFNVTVQTDDPENTAEVKIYENNTELAKAVKNDDGSFTASVRVTGMGTHTLRAAAKAKSGAEGEAAFEVEAVELIKKNDVITPQTAVNLEKGLSTPLGGTPVISSRAFERTLYYSYDFSAIANAGYDIKKAWIVGNAKADALGAKLEFNMLTEELAKSDSYETAPVYEKTPFAYADLSVLEPLKKEDYNITDPEADIYLDNAGLGIDNYNFGTDITEYAKKALERGTLAFRVFTSDSDAEYEFTRDFAICVEYAGKNKAPTVAFEEPADETAFVKDRDEYIPVRFTAEDDGEINVALYLNGREIETERNENVCTAQINVNDIEIGTYTLKAVAEDNGYDGVNGIKTAEAERTFYVVKQDDRIMHKLVAAKDVAQVGNLGKYTVQGDKTSSGYGSAVLVKADLSEVADYDIQKVEIVTGWGSQYGNYNVMLHKIYDNNAWDSGTTTFDKTASAYVSKYSASSNWNGRTLKEGGYEIADENYKVAFDITSAALEELKSGNAVTGYLMRQENDGQRNLGSADRKPMIYVTYKANKLPKINLANPTASAVLSDKEIEVEFTVTDEDSPELAEMHVYFDDKEYAVSNAGELYKALIPAAAVTKGTHTLKITASDWIGGTRILEKNLYVGEYSVNSAQLTNGTGAEPAIKAGETVEIKTNISSAKQDGISVTVMIVLYDANNTAREIKFAKTNIAEGESKDISAQLVIPDINLLNARVKAYIIDGFSTLNLLAEPLELK